MGEQNAFVTIVAPLLGNILAVIMLGSPLPAVWSLRRSKTIGALNTLPYPLTALNCMGWIGYGISLNNAWMVPANFVGLCAGLYFSMQVLPYADRKMQDLTMGLIVVGGAYFSVLGIIGVHVLSEDARNQMWGIQCLVILLMYYAIPLSSMFSVIRTRDASSIYLPLAIASVVNGSMWTLYGLLGTHDFNLWMPNGVGAILGLLQIALRLGYGVAGAQAGTDDHTDGRPAISRPNSGRHLLDSFRRHAKDSWYHVSGVHSPHLSHANSGIHDDIEHAKQSHVALAFNAPFHASFSREEKPQHAKIAVPMDSLSGSTPSGSSSGLNALSVPSIIPLTSDGTALVERQTQTPHKSPNVAAVLYEI